MRITLCVTAMALLLLPVSVAWGQTGTGEVNGTVKDNTGAVVAGANVKLVNLGTQIQQINQTNATGGFVFINVPPGAYQLSVELTGFKTAQVGFSLAVNQSLTQNLVLDVGAVSETVTVTAAAPLIQQSSSELGTVISEQAVKELPLNGRNFTQLMILTPGANPVSTAQGSGISTTDAGITGIPGTNFFKPSLHGQQNRSVLYYLDGITNTDYRGSIYGVLPVIDAVQEFKVQSHDSTAEFGGVVGGIVDVVSKSGTNSFHGAGWEFVRNNAFDARNPFTDFCNAARCGPGSLSTTPAPPIAYHQNEFGTAGGGPIVKNKTFFYAAYEGWRFNKPTLGTTLVPTAAELSGDFSQSYYKNTIYNPYSTVCNNGTCTRQPFAGNILPANLISQPTQSILQAYLQAPNASGLVGINYVEPRVQVDTANSWMVKIDHSITDRQHIFGRLSQMFVADNQPVTGVQAFSPSNYHAYDFGGGYDYVIRPNLILERPRRCDVEAVCLRVASGHGGHCALEQRRFQESRPVRRHVRHHGGSLYDLQRGYRGAGRIPSRQSQHQLGRGRQLDQGKPRHQGRGAVHVCEPAPDQPAATVHLRRFANEQYRRSQHGELAGFGPAGNTQQLYRANAHLL